MNYLDNSDLYLITPELNSEFKRSELKGGEVLLSIQGTIGRVAICPEDLRGANVSRTIAVIDPGHRINRRFLRYWLLSQNEEFPISGSTRASLNIGSIRQLKIPLPSLTIQKSIVAILDEVFSSVDQAIANTEKNLANARELFESYLNSTFAQMAKSGFKNQ